MPTITDLILDKLPGLVAEAQQSARESKEIISRLREKLLEVGWILPFNRLSPDYMSDKTMICIDGANTMSTYQNGDLIVTGASIGEGYETKRLYPDDSSVPSELFARLLPHAAANAHLATAMRALQELRVLASTKEADIRVIDGEYLGSVAELLSRLVDQNKDIVNTLLEENFYDQDEILQSAIYELLHPDKAKQGRIIAVVKNDSNKIYADLFRERWGIEVGTLTDRMIADRVLEPGEFLTPRWLDSNGRLIGVLRTKVKDENYHKVNNKILLDKLVRNSIEPLEMLRSQEFDPTLEGILWSTYFKPTAWSQNDKSIRIEYPFFISNPESESYRDFCRRMVQIIDQDIITPTILEPICQWEADKQAKKVSDATKFAEHSIEQNMDDDDLYRMRGYRT